MSGYIEAGYVAALGTLATYAATLLWRERRLVRRVRETRRFDDRLEQQPNSASKDGVEESR